MIICLGDGNGSRHMYCRHTIHSMSEGACCISMSGGTFSMSEVGTVLWAKYRNVRRFLLWYSLSQKFHNSMPKGTCSRQSTDTDTLRYRHIKSDENTQYVGMLDWNILLNVMSRQVLMYEKQKKLCYMLNDKLHRLVDNYKVFVFWGLRYQLSVMPVRKYISYYKW